MFLFWPLINSQQTSVWDLTETPWLSSCSHPDLAGAASVHPLTAGPHQSKHDSFFTLEARFQMLMLMVSQKKVLPLHPNWLLPVSSPESHCCTQECRNLRTHYQVVAFEDKSGQKSSDLSPLRHICQRIMRERMSGTLTVPSHFLTVTKTWINPVIASHLSKCHELHNS